MPKFRSFTAVLILAVASPLLHAQSRSTTASLSGTVTDPSGARIAKAAVKLTNPENGIVRTDTTSPTGEFLFALLVQGNYTLEVSASGFTTTRQTGLVLATGDTLNLGIRMTIGATQQIIVESTVPLLQTQDASISNEIESKQIEELPLNLRNVLSFATLDSAVNVQGDRQLLAAGGSEDTADQDYSFLNFGGGYFGNNLFLLEGGYDTAQGWGGIFYVPAPEDTAEVKVTSYSFSAQYGFSTGNVISLTTKAGTHDYHFVADEYLRNPAVDANLYFNNLNGIPKPNDHRNQFGIAGGGPLYIPGIYKQRDKTFFFVNYEGLRLNNSGSYSAQVPTAAQLGGDFSAQLTTTSLGTDCLGRTIYQGAIYNPYSLSHLPDRKRSPQSLSGKHHTHKRARGNRRSGANNLPRATTGRRQRIQTVPSTLTPRRLHRRLPTSGEFASTTTSTRITASTGNSRISTRERSKRRPFTETISRGPIISTRTTACLGFWAILTFSRRLLS